MRLLGTLLGLVALGLFLLVASRLLYPIEEFGMSPGTLTQLQSTHVPSGYRASQEDLDALRYQMDWESNELTGSL